MTKYDGTKSDKMEVAYRCKNAFGQSLICLSKQPDINQIQNGGQIWIEN